MGHLVVLCGLLLMPGPLARAVPARGAATVTRRLAPVQRRVLPRAVVVRAGKPLRLRRSLLLRFGLAGTPEVRSAKLVVSARRGGAPLRLWRVRRAGSRYRRLDRRAVRGRTAAAKKGLVRVSFGVTRRVRAGKPVLFLVAAPKGTWSPGPGRGSLIIRGPAPGVGPPGPDPTPIPAPGSTINPTATPQSSPVATPAPTATPTPAPTPTASVLAAGDVACDPADPNYMGGAGIGNSCRQMATSGHLLATPADAVLALGDLQYENASLSQFQSVYASSWGRVKDLTRPVLGNHEYFTTGAAGYFDYFDGVGATTGPAGDRGVGYYSFDLGGWHIVALNANCTEVGCGPGSAQDDWLRSDLAAHPVACTLAFYHQPRFSSGKVPSDPAVAPLWQALYDYGVDLVLNGHAHDYERFAPQDPAGALDPARGIREIVVGTGGKSLHPAGPPIANSEALNDATLGVLKVSFQPDGYTWQFLPAAGGTFTDSGTGSCHGGP